MLDTSVSAEARRILAQRLGPRVWKLITGVRNTNGRDVLATGSGRGLWSVLLATRGYSWGIMVEAFESRDAWVSQVLFS